MNQSRRAFAAAFLCVSLAGLPTSNHARRRSGLGPGVRSRGSKTYDSGTLSSAELEKCVVLDRRMERFEAALEADSAAIEAEREHLGRIRRRIDETNKYVGSASEEDMRDYNRLVRNYNARLKKHRQAIDDYNTSTYVHKAMVDDFNSSCAGKRYYEDDMARVLESLSRRDDLPGLPK